MRTVYRNLKIGYLVLILQWREADNMVDLPKMVESALLSDRQGVTTAVILSNNSRVVKKISEVLPKKLEFCCIDFISESKTISGGP